MEVKNILIIGAGRAGRLLEKDIRENHLECRVIGFVDDSPIESRRTIGLIEDVPGILDIYHVDEMVVAIPSADGKLIRRILLINKQNRIPIKIVPRNQKIISESNVRYADIREIYTEDFLGRPFIDAHVESLKKFYQDKTVFVTGGAGSIGSEIVRQLIDLGIKKVIVYDSSEYLVFQLEQWLKEQGQREKCQLVIGSILHFNKLNSLLKKLKPDIVFHAAAYKHVHLMQDNIDEAIYNNVVGTKRVIDAAVSAHVGLFTFISTDKVVNPTSIMGASKKLCEYYIRSLRGGKTKFNIVRFGNVINSNGSALPLFERQMALHNYVTITHEKMMRFFMSIREAAQLVIESTAKGRPGSIHILNMGELLNIREIAECLIRSKNRIPGEDVEFRITGLRKGEKLIEELYTEAEEKNLKRTNIGNVLRIKNEESCPFDAQKVFLDLEEMAKQGGSSDALGTFLKQVFPSLRAPH